MAGSLDVRPPGPDLTNNLDLLDNQSMNEDSVVASDLTGQTKTLTLTQRPSIGVRAVTITPNALLGSPSATSTPNEKSRKHTRLAAPTPNALEEVDEITGTPRLAHIAKLFPGGSDAASKPLIILIERLIEATRATLIPKTKNSKSVKVDVDSAADILLLAGLIQEQASINEARRVVFEPGQQTIPNPSSSPVSQFDFQVSSILDKLDLVVKQLAKLGSSPASPPPSNQTQTTRSYALAASKHAPTGQQPPTPTRPRPSAQAKPAARTRSDHSVTLNQCDPANIAGSDKSIPELIKYLNAQLKACKVRLTPEDKTDIEVRNIHRHLSGNFVLYLDNAKQAQALRAQANNWLPRISSNLSIKKEVYSVIVHGVPTTFNPES